MKEKTTDRSETGLSVFLVTADSSEYDRLAAQANRKITSL